MQQHQQSMEAQQYAALVDNFRNQNLRDRETIDSYDRVRKRVSFFILFCPWEVLTLFWGL
jgi:hypothetical protein